MDCNPESSKCESLPERILAMNATAREFRRLNASIVPGRIGGPFPGLPRGLLPPNFVSGYAFVREIHRGGQGVVYEATQLSTSRRVAIKLFHRGATGQPRDQRRFEREAELLTSLRHPNIVTVHDAGISAGRHYLILDFVAGQAIDCFTNELRTVREVIKLFAIVCDAINAAHLRGVIHRDIKPANILVDESNQPRVIDFGLAKVTPDFADSSDHDCTREGQFLGSLPWSSPEQVAGRHQELDVRSDVYSLGVLLYQLLSGRFPHDLQGSFREVSERIINVPPAPLRVFSRPNTVVRDSKPRHAVDAELETIVLKCLSKERERRYQTAGALAADLRRYLAGEAIEAQRDSALYVLRKSLWHYRLPVAVAALFVLMLAGGGVLATALWQRAERESLAARQERDKAERSMLLTEEMLAGAGPWAARGCDTTLVREILDTTATRIRNGEFSDTLDSELRLRLIIGLVFAQIGELERSDDMLLPVDTLIQTVCPGDNEQAARAHLACGESDWLAARYPEALERFQTALEICRRVYRGDHPLTVSAMIKVGDTLFFLESYQEALDMSSKALVMAERVLPPDSYEQLTAQNDMACSLMYLNRLEEALPIFQAVLETRRRLIRGDHPDLATSIRNHAECLTRLGRHKEALPEFEEALAMYERLFPADHRVITKNRQTLDDCRASVAAAADRRPAPERARDPDSQASIER